MPGGNHEKLTRTIEVFRPGTFTPMSGQPITFSAQDLQALAQAYDGVGAPAPAVVGHPKTDDPAYGWASAFSYDADSQRLLADLGELDPAFADAVAEGRYKKISLSLFEPSAPNNPKPGAWYPKHIGFLGAAAPAVSGLRPVSFAADASGTVTFEFADASALRDVSTLFRSLREWMIEKFGAEQADKTLPGWSISWINDAADRVTSGDGDDFAAPSPKPSKEKLMNPEKLAADAAALKVREDQLNERERAASHADNLAFAEGLVTAGRLLPVLKHKVVGLLDGLAPVGGAQMEVSFAEGNETKTSGALDLVKAVLSAQPAGVSFGALDLGSDSPSVDFAMPAGMSADPASAERHARAVAYQTAHPGTDYMAAVSATNR